MRVCQAYRYALDPTPEQAADLASHCGAARFAFNWGLARVKAALSQREAEKSYDVPDELLTEVPWSLYGLRRAWNTAKDQAARREGGRWFVAFTCEIDRTNRVPARPDAVVGVDLGVKNLAVLSTGEVVANPGHHRSALKRLRRLNKQLARRVGPRTPDGGGREPSARWATTKAALGKAHAHVANRRRDGVHKLTTRLAGIYGTVVVEDLNVSGMLAGRRLARAVADVGMAEVRRQLTYKTRWNGGGLVVADRWFASSKTCSGCGAVKAKLALSEREYTCTGCGLILDRDHNAALNLAALAADVAQSRGETENARGGAVRPGVRAGRAPAKREPRKSGNAVAATRRLAGAH